MKKKILIIEDDPDVRFGYHLRLKADNYDTFFAADALTSIAEARKHQPDVIVLDLGLPVGDGFVVMERLKTNPHLAVIPISVVSGRDPHANRERALRAGAKAFCKNQRQTSERHSAMSGRNHRTITRNGRTERVMPEALSY